MAEKTSQLRYAAPETPEPAQWRVASPDTQETTRGSAQAGQGAMEHAPGGGAPFVPPSIEMMTGESVMPEDYPGMPLIPSPTRMPETVENPYYVSGFLKNYIGKNMRVQFLIGENTLMDRTGRLIDIGASFIVLQPVGSDDLLMCDLYSIKFVTIYR